MVSINGFNQSEIYKLYEYLVKYEKFSNRCQNLPHQNQLMLNAIYNYIHIIYGNYEQIKNYKKKPIPTEIITTTSDIRRFIKSLRDMIAHAYIRKSNDIVFIENYKQNTSINTLYGEIPSTNFFEVLEIIKQNI